MAQTHLNTVLTEAGLEAADIESILAVAEDATDFDAKAVVGKITSARETALKNDPKFWEALDENNVNEAFKKKIEAQQYGRAANIVRQKTLKTLGLVEDDFKDLPEEDKNKLEVFITKAAEKYATSKAGDKDLQQQLVSARKKLEELELDIPAREGKIKQDFEAKFNDEKLDFIILAELATVANLKAPAQYLVQKLSAELREENAFVVEGLKASPKQKANPALDVLDGAKVLTLKDLIVRKLTADGLIEAAPDPTKLKQRTTVEVDPDGKGGLEISGHIAEKIKANTPAE